MAENGNSNGEGKSNFGFLTKKIGPLPIWVYALLIVAAYYWYTHYGPGAQKQQPQTPVATDTVTRSGGPTLETIHMSHQRPNHSRKGDNGNG